MDAERKDDGCTVTAAAGGAGEGLRLALIDDDLMSREVLVLLAGQAGFAVSAYESGDEAVAAFSGNKMATPDAVLSDLQMPGLSGTGLAARLRELCGPATTLLAMSGSAPPPALRDAFDGFLMKPFTVEELVEALAVGLRSPDVRETSAPSSVHGRELSDHVNPAVYANLAAAMKPEQLAALYEMCLDDADRRLATMRKASEKRDRAAYVAAAHAVKGGCGMVGATRLAAIAARMERDGPPEVDDSAPFEEFLAASGALRGILKANVPR